MADVCKLAEGPWDTRSSTTSGHGGDDTHTPLGLDKAPHVLHGAHCESAGQNRSKHCLDSDIFMIITMSRCKLKMLHRASCLSYVVSMLLFLSSLLTSLLLFVPFVYYHYSVENEQPNFEPTYYRQVV